MGHFGEWRKLRSESPEYLSWSPAESTIHLDLYFTGRYWAKAKSATPPLLSGGPEVKPSHGWVAGHGAGDERRHRGQVGVGEVGEAASGHGTEDGQHGSLGGWGRRQNVLHPAVLLS